MIGRNIEHYKTYTLAFYKGNKKYNTYKQRQNYLHANNISKGKDYF